MTLKPKIHRNVTYAQAFNLAVQAFGYDKDKAIKWWMSPCAALGDKSPFALVRDGDGRKVMDFLTRTML